MKKNIAVLGSLTVDLFVRPSESQIITTTTEHSENTLFALPHGGKISADHIQEHFGGGAANVGISFARLGDTVECYGGIGDDSNGEKIITNIENEKISGKKIQRFSETQSGFSLILNAFDGERTVIFTSQANKKFNTLKEEISENNEAIYLCHISGNNPEPLFKKIQKFLETHPEKKLFWNPGTERLSLGINHKTNAMLLNHCDILFLNTEEAEKFSGLLHKKTLSHGDEMRNKHTLATKIPEKNIPEFVREVSHIAQKILASGVQTVVITDGRKGAQVFSKCTGQEYLFIPCVLSKRVDTLGAGDSFASTFSHFYLQGESLQKCGEYASLNAASVVSHQGAQDGLMNHKQIMQ